FFKGGIALVGEEGPELVGLPRGAAVRTAAQTRQLVQQPRRLGVAAAPAVNGAAGSGRVALTITNWKDGTGHMTSIADSRVSSASDLAREHRRSQWSTSRP
ncbi:MAG: hypothetical protein H7290_11115, partial [Flavobacterium sp.]